MKAICTNCGCECNIQKHIEDNIMIVECPQCGQFDVMEIPPMMGGRLKNEEEEK